MGKHIPLRMCIACRKMKPKSELVRIVTDDGSILIDENMKIQKRGAYVCKCSECIKLMRKKHGLERVFRGKVDEETYNMFDKYTE